MGKNQYIRFDWAMKRLLRDKANFGVLEGLLTTLLREPIIIKELLESESNCADDISERYRTDLLIENSQGKMFLLEIQNNNELTYYQRILFGLSKQFTEYINRGEGYQNIRKIYSVNIVYFNLGNGTDVVYHGKTEFRGIHNGELLNLSPFQQQKFQVDEVSDLYPEYYILKVNDFDKWSKVPLEQWIYFLNTGNIPADATAPGLEEAREKLRLEQMSKAELKAYYHHLDNVVILRDNIITARGEGRLEGRAEGREEGRKEGREEGRKEERFENARNFKKLGVPIEIISQATGLTAEEIAAL